MRSDEKTEKFIKKARSIHKNFYDFSKIKYLGANKSVTVICKSHGEFKIRAYRFAKGQGCNKCRLENEMKKNRSNFIRKAKLIHKDSYCYDGCEYKNAREKITIICNVHGPFEQLPTNHLKGHGCNKCGDKKAADLKRSSRELFIKTAIKVHGDFYDYSEVAYKTAHLKVKIICPLHGAFFQKPTNHTDGEKGCYICGTKRGAKKQTNKLSTFLKQARLIHDDFYNYSKSKYQNAKTDIIITCPKHGDFKQQPTNHLQGKGCPDCRRKSEGRISLLLDKKKVVYEREFIIENRRFDFYIPDLNLLIERDGVQHYEESRFFNLSLKDQIKVDREKTKLAKKKGYQIARIPYWLSEVDEEIEIQNILVGRFTYPEIPNIRQNKSKPKPKKNS